jgi:RNA 3'-terminal phosphate cyclase (ATP)
MNKPLMNDPELVRFLQWCLPKLGLRWAGFRKVRGTVRKRLNRRIRELRLPDLAAYRDRLKTDPDEWDRLEVMCRIPISRFYRDKAVYDFLAGAVLPACAQAAQSRKDRTVRVLSAGCASGEEPYTIALIWTLRLAERFPGVALNIAALDIDDTMLSRAKTACYVAGSFKDLPSDLRENGFESVEGVYCLRQAFRSCVKLQKADIRQGLPDGPFDLVLCRNTAFTYFDDAAQKAVLSDLDAKLRSNGYLVIGGHESLPGDAREYERLTGELPVYRKAAKGLPRPAGPQAGIRQPLVLDGSYGEGGGQILRSALSLSAITGRPVRIEKIRAHRRRPGLAAQHLTAVWAVAAICGARLHGDAIGSTELDFSPHGPVKAGTYDFDVAAARKGGSAGSAPLVLQAMLVPLALCSGASRVTVRGGTHVPWSPSFDYIRDVWLLALGRIGIAAEIRLDAWGWFPAGRGQIQCDIAGGASEIRPVLLLEPGPLQRVTGRAVAAHLPAHIAIRMAERAADLLTQEGISAAIAAEAVESVSSGAGIFLTAHYENVRCGFAGHGKRGRPAEEVAGDAAGLVLTHYRSGAALEVHLADQLVLPLALAAGASEYSVERLTRHIETHAWLVEQFGLARVRLSDEANGTGVVRIMPESQGN